MSAISLKSFVVTAAIGLATVFGARASANAASPMSTPAISTAGHASVVDVQLRRGRGPACSVQTARARAMRMGIRNPRVSARGRSVVVRGFRRGRPATVVFANMRGCPIIR